MPRKAGSRSSEPRTPGVSHKRGARRTAPASLAALERWHEERRRLKAAAAATEAVKPLVEEAPQPVIRSGPQPGETIFDKNERPTTKRPWTTQDILARYPMVTWTPTRSCPITVHGLTVFVHEGVEIRTPCVYKTVFEESNRDYAEGQRALRDQIQAMTGMEVGIEAGAAAAPEAS